MKKLTLTLVLLLAFSVFNFADEGGTPGGNKNCPNPAQPCLVEPDPEILIIKPVWDILISALL